LRQLLNHTGGIPDYGALPAYTAALKADPAHPWTSEQFLAHTLAWGLNFAPGQGWAYSNVGYLLLRAVVEAISRVSLSAAFADRLFTPLALQRASVAQDLQDARRLTPGYSAFFSPDNSPGALRDVRAVYHPGWVSHGVVIATAADLARLVDAIFAGPLLGPQSRAAMLEGVPVRVNHPLFRQPAYGLGAMVDLNSRYGVIAGHGGGGPGYSAGALHVPSANGHHITSVALANRDAGELGLRIAFELAMAAGEMLER
jgi:D-alanyl-D-alanine carboxypeptidase